MALTNGQIIVDGTSLDNGSWRRLSGQIAIGKTGSPKDGMLTVFAAREFTISANTPEVLMQRWNTTVTEFTKRNVAVSFSIDGASADVMDTLSAFASGNQENICSVELLDEYTQTATSLRAVLNVITMRPVPSDSGSYTGQSGEINYSVVYNAGRVEARSASGTFIRTDASTSAYANYSAARSSLLTLIGVGSGGARDATTGLALSQESLGYEDDDNNTLVFLISSEWMPIAFSDSTLSNAARRLELAISTSVPELWDYDSGPIPTIITASGKLTVSKDLLNSEPLTAWWLRARSDIITEVKRQAARDATLISQALGFSPNGQEITFELSLQTGGLIVFSYSREESLAIRNNVTTWRDGTKRYAQRPEGPPDMSIAIAITRSGEGEADLTPEAPSYLGYTWVAIDPLEKKSRKATEFGNVIYNQSYTVTYLPFDPSTGITEVSPSVTK